MSVSRQVCEQCSGEISELDPAPVCPTCGGLLELVHDFSGWSDDSAGLRARFSQRRSAMVGSGASGVWRYRELVLPSVRDSEIVSQPEGNTPLLSRSAVSDWA